VLICEIGGKGYLLKDFFSSDGLLAAQLASYEFRADQLLMAEAIYDLLAGEEHAAAGSGDYAEVMVIEAETGIGKSLAYLVPAIVSGKRVVVSTATINLQDQLIDKEIPLVSKLLGQEIAALCVKGRQNYLCLYRWQQYRYSPQVSLVGDEECDRIEAWLANTETGDRAELDWLADRGSLWPKISAHSYQCLGSECPDSSACFINRLRRKAGSARILVVNHHLYFSDLALRRRGFGEILPRHEAVIFDEAHHLEQVATNFFGLSFSQYQVYDLAGDIAQQAEVELPPEIGDRIIGTSRGIRQRIEHFTALFPARRGRFSLLDFIEEQQDWPAQMQLVAAGLERLADDLDSISRNYESWQMLAERARELHRNFLFVGLPEPQLRSEDHVYWYERRERALSLSATPVNVAEDLRSSLFAMVPRCILTSATLTSGGSFDYFRDRLGLSEVRVTMRLKSPFDYQNRSILYIPAAHVPEPSANGYETALCEQIEALLNITRGRALVLFTSFRAMDLAAEYLTRSLVFPVLVQGTASRSRLLERFREQTESVLLAVASFWEGVDIAGESLSAVIIDKLPFEVPSDPVVQARMQAISSQGGNPFFDFQIPRAVLSLRQGVGRLMRNAGDAGLISVLDTRLFSKRYGRVFLKSLPPSPVVRDMNEVHNFFAKLESTNSDQEKPH
jgi:ATP-dependent DNA helicase DinG